MKSFPVTWFIFHLVYCRTNRGGHRLGARDARQCLSGHRQDARRAEVTHGQGGKERGALCLCPSVQHPLISAVILEGAPRGGAPATGRARDINAVRHRATRSGRSYQGEEAGGGRCGCGDQEAGARCTDPREGKGGPCHRRDKPRETARLDQRGEPVSRHAAPLLAELMSTVCSASRDRNTISARSILPN